MKYLSKISTHPNLKKGLVFFDQAMVSGSNFILGILLVRFIGIESYGVFALLWMGVLFALGINQAFITKPLMSIAPKLEDEKQEEYFQHLHIIQILVSVLFFILGMFVFIFSNLFWEDYITVLIPLTSGIIFCQILHDFYRKTNFVKNKIMLVVLLDAIFYIGQLVGIMSLIFLNRIGLEEILMVILVVNIISISIGGMVLGIQRSEIKNHLEILYRHFHFSKWLLGTSILQWLSGNYFIIVGASILGTSAVGAVRLVQNIMGLCHVLFLAMENIVPIEAARQFHLEGEDALTKYLVQISWKLGFGFCIILLGLTFFSPQILFLLYGAEAVEHTYIVFAYAFLYVLVFLGHPFRFFMRTIEQTRPIFMAYILSTVFSLCFANVLLQEFEMRGLLFGLIATQAIALIIYYVFLPKVVVAVPDFE